MVFHGMLPFPPTRNVFPIWPTVPKPPNGPDRTTANNGEVFGGELPHYTQLMQVGDPQTEVSETFGNEAVSLEKNG